MKSYRELDIFKESAELAIEVHKMSMLLPKFELYEEGTQIRRSSKAITALIVEGYGRKRYKQDFIKYLVYAHSECDETIIHLDFLFSTKSLENKNLYDELIEKYSVLSRKINKFIQYVEETWNDFQV